MSGLTYVITGAGKGIGKGLVSNLIVRPKTTVIATVRDVASATENLSNIPVGKDSKLIIVKIDATVDSDPSTAVEELKTKYNISHVDVLISNAGILDIIAPVVDTPADQVRKHFEVNAIAPIVLFQAFIKLLEASASPKFLVITSTIGSIEEIKNMQVPFFAYGVSKAAANYFVRKVAFEHPKIVSAAFNPGWVQTDMGTGAAKGVGLDDAPTTLEDSVKGLIKHFDEASLETTGTFTDTSTGSNVPW